MPKAAKRNICEPCPRCRQNLERLHAELGHFADMFDYKSNGKPWGTVKDALERCINKICGRIIEKP